MPFGHKAGLPPSKKYLLMRQPRVLCSVAHCCVDWIWRDNISPDLTWVILSAITLAVFLADMSASHCGRIRPDLKHGFFNLPSLSVFRDIFLRHVDCHRAVATGWHTCTEGLRPHRRPRVNAVVSYVIVLSWSRVPEPRYSRRRPGAS